MQTLPDLDVDDNEFPVFEPGQYYFEVIDAVDKESEKGNSMIKLTLRVTHPLTCKTGLVWDYLVAIESMEWKTRHFAKFTGVEAAYNTGNLTALDCLNNKGQVRLNKEPPSINKKTGKSYPEKNTVNDYLESGVSPIEAGAANIKEDDIPF